MKLQRLLLAAVLPAALFVTACGGGDDSLDDRIDAADPKVRLVHAIEGPATVTLFREDVAVTGATAVGYGYISPYDATGTQVETWRVANSVSGAALGEVDINARRGDKYTLLAVPNGNTAEVVLIEDPYDNQDIGSDDARVRVFHAAANAGDVDIYITAPSADLAAATPVLTGVGQRDVAPASGSDSVDLEPGTYVVSITAAGTKTVVFRAQFALTASADWLLVALPNSAAANDIKLLAAEADADNTAVELFSQPL